MALLGSGDGDEFDRHLDSSALGHAYADRPRPRCTKTSTETQKAPGTRWRRATSAVSLAANCKACARCLDPAWATRASAGIGDAWYGAIGQIDGVKVWEIGESLLDPTNHPTHEVTTLAGVVLLLPKGLPHAVRTPRDPGHSVHRAFAIDRDPDPRAGTIAARMRAAMP